MLNERFQLLLTKKLANELTPDEHLEFIELVNSDAELNKIYADLKSFWIHDEEVYNNNNALFQNILKKIEVSQPLAEDTTAEDNIVALKPNRLLSFTRVAAAILIAAILSTGLYYYSNKKQVTQPINTDNLEVLNTPSRKKTRIVLSDGSVVTINSQSQLKYPAAFTGDTREVYLQGEGFFDIKKDPDHPFIVHTDQMHVKVLGTAFNVKAYANDKSCEATLIHGAIELTLADRPADRIILKPNEKLVLRKRQLIKPAMRVGVKHMITDTARTSYLLTNLTRFKVGDSTVVETSWTNNKLVFKDQDLESLTRQMERWFGMKITITNEALKKYNYTGVFEHESITQALYALQIIEPFKYKVNNQVVYIY